LQRAEHGFLVVSSLWRSKALVQGIETTRVGNAFAGQRGLGVERQLDLGAGGDQQVIWASPSQSAST
jgi:hypothetical protein